MAKRFLIFAFLFMAGASVFAENEPLNVNMTPKNTFSGYSSETRVNYPRINNSYYNFNEQRRNEILKPKSVREITNSSNMDRTTAPMTYDRFPKNYDSSNMMQFQELQSGIQNMHMGY